MRRQLMKLPELDEIRWRREKHAVEIRSKRRSEETVKRRGLLVEPESWTKAVEKHFPHFAHGVPLSDVLECIKVQLLSAPSLTELNECVVTVRLMLSEQSRPPIKEVVKAGFVPVLVKVLDLSRFPPEMASEAALALANIASTSNQSLFQELISNNAPAALLACLASDNSELLDNVVLALGNIAGDRVESRNCLLRLEAVQALVRVYNRLGISDLRLLKRLTWCLGNCMRGEPSPQTEHIYAALPVFVDLLRGFNESLLSRILWGLTNIARGGKALCQLVIEAGCLPKAVECIAYGNRQVHLPAIVLIGTITLGDEAQIDVLFSLNILEKLSFIIMSRDKEVRKQTYWVLSNLAADFERHAELIVNNPIIHLALNGLTDADHDVRREASYLFRNISLQDSDNPMRKLQDIGLIPVLKESLEGEDEPRIALNLLDVCRVMLYYGSSDEGQPYNSVSELFIKHGLEEVIDSLLSHSNDTVADSARSILDKYFDVVDEEMEIEYTEPAEFAFS